MKVQEKARAICTKLISRKVLPKDEVKDIFRDDNLRLQVEDMLQATGLELATHIYTDHVALQVCKDMESTAFDNGQGGWLKTNIGLSRGAITLLVIIWGKLILPKRQMQIERKTPGDSGQMTLLKERKPVPKKDLVSLDEKALLADFGKKLGGKTRFGTYMAELNRHGFVHRRKGTITEGPLLDTIVDYHILASRIIDGCLAEVIGAEEEKEEDDVSV